MGMFKLLETNTKSRVFFNHFMFFRLFTKQCALIISFKIAFSSQRVPSCNRFCVDVETGETQCIKPPDPKNNKDDEIDMAPDAPKENERSFLEQTLNPRAVDANGYK